MAVVEGHQADRRHRLGRAAHQTFIVSGHLHVVMEDGAEFDVRTGDADHDGAGGGILIATGASARQAAYVLGIAPKTAATHIERIYMKCSVSTRSDATRFAIAPGLVEAIAPTGR